MRLYKVKKKSLECLKFGVSKVERKLIKSLPEMGKLLFIQIF
jgi:hypothetical protein